MAQNGLEGPSRGGDEGRVAGREENAEGGDNVGAL